MNQPRKLGPTKGGPVLKRPIRPAKNEASECYDAAEVFKTESAFYNASDVVASGPFDAEITVVEWVVMPDGNRKVAFTLAGHDKKLVVNKVNGMALAEGIDETDIRKWAGYWVNVSTAKVQSPQGRGMVDGIRLQWATETTADEEPFDET